MFFLIHYRISLIVIKLSFFFCLQAVFLQNKALYFWPLALPGFSGCLQLWLLPAFCRADAVFCTAGRHLSVSPVKIVMDSAQIFPAAYRLPVLSRITNAADLCYLCYLQVFCTYAAGANSAVAGHMAANSAAFIYFNFEVSVIA